MSLTNVKAGQAGTIAFIQDSTGGRTAVFDSVFKFAGGVTGVMVVVGWMVEAAVKWAIGWLIGSILKVKIGA